MSASGPSGPLVLDTCKQVFWQTVKTQIKYGIIRHFIRICAVCIEKNYMTEMHHYLERSTFDPLTYKMGNSILIISTCIFFSHKFQN